MRRILNPTEEGAGSRVFPAKGSQAEKKIGLRLDKGEKVHDKPNFLRLKLQVNKGAEDPALKKMADKNSHAVIATVDVDTTQEVTEENLRKVFDHLAEKSG